MRCNPGDGMSISRHFSRSSRCTRARGRPPLRPKEYWNNPELRLQAKHCRRGCGSGLCHMWWSNTPFFREMRLLVVTSTRRAYNYTSGGFGEYSALIIIPVASHVLMIKHLHVRKAGERIFPLRTCETDIKRGVCYCRSDPRGQKP